MKNLFPASGIQQIQIKPMVKSIQKRLMAPQKPMPDMSGLNQFKTQSMGPNINKGKK